MKLYSGNEIDNIKEVKLINVIAKQLRTNTDFKVNVGYNGDESGSWIEITEDSGSEKKDVLIQFNFEGTEIDGIGVFLTPIERVIVDDKMRKIL